MRRLTTLLLLLLFLIGTLGCGHRAAQPEATAAAGDGPRPVDPRWVTIYDPRLAWTGYTLTLHRGRMPVLLDMNGRPVHRWPDVKIKSRVRLLPDGSILGLAFGREVVQYDWDGRQTWSFNTGDAIPHHDIIRLANGNTLVLVLSDGETADTLLEVDRAGKVVWSWKAIERLGKLIPAKPSHPNEITHINSLQELPENPWHAAGDERFRPGNLLISARNLDTVFIIDRKSGEVVWSYTEDLDLQHEALMNGPGLPEPGMIHLFNNRRGSFWSDRQSELLEIDPRRGSVVWRYKTPGFFSPTAGTQQVLPNGNLLVTSTRGGRVFELTHDGRIVWQWVPPFEPVRALRVAADFCPQLARLAPQTPQAVTPAPGYRYIDPEAYKFARQGSRTEAVVDGEKRGVLKEENDCRDLLLPAAARLQVGYGVDRDRLRAAGRADRPPRFTVRLHHDGAAEGDRIELLGDTVGLDGPSWREKTLPLDAYAGQAVELCVEVDGGKAPTARKAERFAFWDQPMIVTPLDLARAQEGDGDDDDPRNMTPEEQDVRRKHLKALGYIG
ncbi:MAG TPA: arylsulfotransferase family protein [Thermoanaerobaculia bacterium]|jgi:outer membrane protein assembly factor BamB|nr:arylsulfotransferase family protein [Thermoanaerobaculia bacterium]